MRQQQTGFTLIELMIVVAIVAILAGIGYPSYSSYIQATNRNDAKAALYKLVNLQEQHYLDFDRYATSLASGALPGWGDGTDYYDFALDASSSETSYTAVATATGKQLADTNCHKFFINQFNVTSAETNTGASADDCW